MNTKAAMRLTSSKRHLIFIVILLVVSTFAFVFVSDTYALNLTSDVNLIRGNMQYNFASPANVSDCDMSNQLTLLGNPNSNTTCYVRSVTLEFPSESYQVADYLTFPLYIFNNQNNNSSDAMVSSLSVSTSGWDLANISFEQLTGSSGVINITIKNYTAGSYNSFVLTSITGTAFANLQSGEYLASGLATHWRPVTGTNYSGNFDSVINAINAQPNYTQSLNNIRNDIQGLQNAQEQANQDANDRYEDEKQTIQDNADAAQEDYDSLDDSSASIFNPFNSFFNRLRNNDQDCTDIPTIASWLHSNETHICSPWPTRPRYVISYSIIILLTLALFITIVRYAIKFKSGSD